MIAQPTFVPPAHLDLPLPDLSNVGIHPIGIVFSFLLLHAVLIVVGVSFLMAMDWWTRRNFWILFLGIGIPLWIGATVLVYRCIWNGTQVKVLIVEVEAEEVREVIRFVDLRSGPRVDVRDLLFFCEQVDAGIRSAGRDAWRGVQLPSNTRCGDAVHGMILDALEEAGIWKRGRGTGAGRLLKGLEEIKEIFAG